ncbi:MAG TPA: multiheme c-type cytochrome [Blastocatellia bacterium]|nr:multiheme c-type cytochrome [Blastocatellia bacterium]
MLKAYSQFPVDVLNLSSHDLRYFADSLSKDGVARSADTEPQVNRLVSANTIDERTGSQLVRPFIVREVLSNRTGAKPVRVAFIGLTETTPDPPSGVKFTDPAEAARRTVPEARKVADLVVVLAKIKSQPEVARIAREVTGIDVIIDGNASSLEDGFTPPVYVGPTLLVFTPYETRMLGELRFYRDAHGKFSTKQRFVTLDEMLVPEDPAAKQVVAAAANAESNTRTKSARLLEEWLGSSRMRVTAPPADTGSSPAFATSAACTQCHASQYLKWSKSGHAHATDPLVGRALEFDMSCLGCHATSAGLGGTMAKLETSRFQGVQCEQCHGPGSNHVAKPGKGYGRVGDMRVACGSCHTSETSPAFDPQAAWAKIAH